MKTEEGHRIPRIRLLRRRAGLSQLDLAALLGYRSHSQVSRYENGRRIPTTDELIQLEVIFGVVPSGVFPDLRDHATQMVVARIDKLLSRERRIRPPSLAQPSPKAAHFQRVLDSIRCQIAPGLDAHQPWPTATALEEPESSES